MEYMVADVFLRCFDIVGLVTWKPFQSVKHSATYRQMFTSRTGGWRKLGCGEDWLTQVHLERDIKIEVLGPGAETLS